VIIIFITCFNLCKFSLVDHHLQMSYGAANPPLTNNPFIANHPHPSNRYPDISTAQIQPQSTTWPDPTSTLAQQQHQPDIYQQYAQIHQPQNFTGYPPQQPQVPLQHPQNYPPPYPQSQSHSPTSFQPSSSFGQTLQASISGSSYGYLQPGQHQPPPQQNAYNPARQQLENNPNYVAQFDPYGPISHGWADTTTSQSQSLAPPVSTNNNFGYGNSNQINSGPAGDRHPREYIHSHKQEIEAWDSYTWRQLFNSFEALNRAWEMRRNELKEKVGGLQAQLRYAGYYDRTQIQHECGRMQGLLNDAQSNFDTVAASKLQFDEVYGGYRQSGDMSSKRRVREATNAALQKLPGWPQSY